VRGWGLGFGGFGVWMLGAPGGCARGSSAPACRMQAGGAVFGLGRLRIISLRATSTKKIEG
jgi:hypothetical protein